MIKFLKIIRQIKLDFNVCLFITGIENLFNISDLQNLVYILRSASLYMPPYLRFVFTAEKRESRATSLEMTMRMLATRRVIDVVD